jgi:hypothetical protein
VIRNGTIRAWPNGGIAASTAPESHYKDLRLLFNSGGGLNVGTRSVVQDCFAAYNIGTGIYGDLEVTMTIIHCTAVQNSHGIHAGQYSTLIGCTAYSNGVNGIFASMGSTIRNCTSSRNGQDGIASAAGSYIFQCTAVSNNAYGITASADCRIEQNHCAYNGAGGIRTTSTRHMIKDNTLIRNGFGLRVDSFGSLIAGNMAVSSITGTNYLIAADNKVGVIVQTPNSPAITGSTGGVGVATTDPWANFSY